MDSIPTVSRTIPDLANDYFYRYKDSEVAINKLIKSQINKNTVNGFVTSLGGVVILAVKIVMMPTKITSVMYVRMIIVEILMLLILINTIFR